MENKSILVPPKGNPKIQLYRHYMWYITMGFSPLLPLSHKLKNTDYRYKIGNGNMNQLFFMDDLKLFAKNDEDLEGLLRTVKRHSTLTSM